MIDQAKRAKLLERGFVLFPQVLPSEFVQQLRDVTDKMLGGRDHSATRSQGSMMLTSQNPAFAELITYAPAMSAISSLGYAKPTFSDGYIISKPGASPRLFWHYPPRGHPVRLGRPQLLRARAPATLRDVLSLGHFARKWLPARHPRLAHPPQFLA